MISNSISNCFRDPSLRQLLTTGNVQPQPLDISQFVSALLPNATSTATSSLHPMMQQAIQQQQQLQQATVKLQSLDDILGTTTAAAATTTTTATTTNTSFARAPPGLSPIGTPPGLTPSTNIVPPSIAPTTPSPSTSLADNTTPTSRLFKMRRKEILDPAQLQALQQLRALLVSFLSRSLSD
jgi:hypothetical protein